MLTLTAMADVRAKQGCADEAVVMIDEAMTGVMTGGLPPWAMCHVICRTLIVCDQIGDYERGNQWADAVKSSLAGHVPLSGECRVHRATLLRP
jgi:hypothetical protein